MAKIPKYELTNTEISIDKKTYLLKDLKEMILQAENTHNRSIIIVLIGVIILFSGAHFLWFFVIYLIWRLSVANKRRIVILLFVTDERLKKEDTQHLVFYDVEKSEMLIKEIDEKIKKLGLPIPKFNNSETNL